MNHPESTLDEIEQKTLEGAREYIILMINKGEIEVSYNTKLSINN